MHLKAHKVMQQGCFSHHCSLATSMTNIESKLFTDILFYLFARIHQVRILVFDNYQTCLVPLTVVNCSGRETRPLVSY